MKKLTFYLVAGLILIGAMICGCKIQATQKSESNKIIGAWYVDAVGAPFQPHIAIFHSDQTMIINNPEFGDPHTSDSMGMGPWRIDKGGDQAIIKGAFVEINADRTTNKYVSKLVVHYTLTVSGNTFTGPAQANYYNPDGTLQSGPFLVILNGKKINAS